MLIRTALDNSLTSADTFLYCDKLTFFLVKEKHCKSWQIIYNKVLSQECHIHISLFAHIYIYIYIHFNICTNTNLVAKLLNIYLHYSYTQSGF